jgi:membrane protease YdiL (CAAX protease family)
MADTSAKEIPWSFFGLLVLLSLPFWVIGATSRGFLPKSLPLDLPVSALMAVNPCIAAAVLTFRERGWEGVRTLLRRAVDFPRIRSKIWYLPMLVLWPTTMVLAYAGMRLMGTSLPEPKIPVSMIPILGLAFALSAAGEELGWQGYAFAPLQNRWNALGAAVVVGTVWGVWHMVPFAQSHRPTAWIVWQTLGMIPFRVLIVWLFNNTGRSVFAAIVFHATSNVSQFLFPNYGSHYDPLIPGLILALAAAGVTVLWGPESLACYRFGRRKPSPSVRSARP